MCWALGTWTKPLLSALKVLPGEPDKQGTDQPPCESQCQVASKGVREKLPPEEVVSALGPGGGGDTDSGTLQQGAPRTQSWGDLGAAEGTPGCPA